MVDPLLVENVLPATGVPEAKAVTSTSHHNHSTLRERIIEHVFVGEALRALWRRGIVDVEVLHAEFDAQGYDIVMERGRIVRHIQFKTGMSPRPDHVSVSKSLFDKRSGCVIWIRVTADLDMGPFFWFGGIPATRYLRSQTIRIHSGQPTTDTGRSRFERITG